MEGRRDREGGGEERKGWRGGEREGGVQKCKEREGGRGGEIGRVEGRRERRGWRGGEIGRVEGRKGRVGGEEREREGCRKVRRGKGGGRK